MPNYKQLYTHLFKKVSETNLLLEQAQLESEQLYLETDNSPQLLLLGKKPAPNEPDE